MDSGVFNPEGEKGDEITRGRGNERKPKDLGQDCGGEDKERYGVRLGTCEEIGRVCDKERERLIMRTRKGGGCRADKRTRKGME